MLITSTYHLRTHVLFRRAERSLFAQGHVKMISLFPVRDIPLRFIFLNLKFSAPIGRTYDFWINITRGHDLSYPKSSAAIRGKKF